MDKQPQFELLLKTVLETNDSFVLDEVLTSAAIGISEAIGLPYCGIYLINEENSALNLKGRAGRISDQSLLQAMADGSISIYHPLVRRVLDAEEPIAIFDVAQSELVDEYHKRKLGLKSLLAIPLKARQRPLGLAMIPSFDRCVMFESDRVAMANSIAKAVALAIDNAQLFQETHGLTALDPGNQITQQVNTDPSQHLTGGLTNRELEVLELMAQGLRNKEVAIKLYITEKTVKAHVSSILNKLNVIDRTAAVTVAIKRGIIKL